MAARLAQDGSEYFEIAKRLKKLFQQKFSKIAASAGEPRLAGVNVRCLGRVGRPRAFALPPTAPECTCVPLPCLAGIRTDEHR